MPVKPDSLQHLIGVTVLTPRLAWGVLKLLRTACQMEGVFQTEWQTDATPFLRHESVASSKFPQTDKDFQPLPAPPHKRRCRTRRLTQSEPPRCLHPARTACLQLPPNPHCRPRTNQHHTHLVRIRPHDGGCMRKMSCAPAHPLSATPYIGAAPIPPLHLREEECLLIFVRGVPAPREDASL